MGWNRWLGGGLVVGLCTSGCESSGGGGSEGDEDAQSSSGESGDTEATSPGSDTGTTEADSEGGSDSDSEGDSGTDTGIEPPPPGGCTTAPGDHAASCPDDVCPILVDVDILCDGDRFGVTGVRVAADDDSTIATMGGDELSWVFDATADDAITTSLLPEGVAGRALLLAQASDGSVRIMIDATKPSSPGMFEGGIVMVTSDGDEWTAEDVWGAPDHYTEVLDFEFVDDVAHAWFRTGPPEEISHGVRGEDGTWDVTVVDLVADGGGWERFSLVDGESVAHDMVEDVTGTPVLASRIDGQDTVWESSAIQSYYRQYRLPPPPASGLDPDPATWAAAMAAPTGVYVMTGPGANGGFALPDTATPQNYCGVGLQPPGCDMECDYQASGQSNEEEGFAVARTADGTLWVAVAVIHFDQDWSFAEVCSEKDGCYCAGSIDDDDSTGEVRLYRVAEDGSSGALVLTVPTGVPATTDTYDSGFGVDLRAWGDDLALGVKSLVQPDVFLGAGSTRLRLLRIDTALLPAE